MVLKPCFLVGFQLPFPQLLSRISSINSSSLFSDLADFETSSTSSHQKMKCLSGNFCFRMLECPADLFSDGKKLKQTEDPFFKKEPHIKFPRIQMGLV